MYRGNNRRELSFQHSNIAAKISFMVLRILLSVCKVVFSFVSAYDNRTHVYAVVGSHRLGTGIHKVTLLL